MKYVWADLEQFVRELVRNGHSYFENTIANVRIDDHIADACKVLFYLAPFHGAAIRADLVFGGLTADCAAGVPKTAQLGDSLWTFIDLMQWQQATDTWHEIRDDVTTLYWWKSDVCPDMEDRVVARFLSDQQIHRSLYNLRYLYLEPKPQRVEISCIIA